MDLLTQPFTFTQARLLTPKQFAEQAKLRGVRVDLNGLEQLHRLRLVEPLFRVRRDGREIDRLARLPEDYHARSVARSEVTSRRDVLMIDAAGRLTAPVDEPFTAYRRQQRTARGLRYSHSAYLYSPHQLLDLDLIATTVECIRVNARGDAVGLDDTRVWTDEVRRQASERRRLVFVLSTLEPLYYPRIWQTITFEAHQDFDAHDRWRRRTTSAELAEWAGVDRAWATDSARRLVRRADAVDPLREWLDLTREVRPAKWKELRGDARIAIDLRVAAEVLFRAAHEADGDAQVGGTSASSPGRLRPTYRVDRTITRFGLSPHSQLVLVLEGATELLLFPRVMRHFGVSTDPAFIALLDAEGVARNLRPLVAHAVTPRFSELDDKYVSLDRPPTRLLVVADAEDQMASPEMREERRQTWIDRVMAAVSPEFRTSGVRAYVSDLVSVEVWREEGESFEFAHFTDHELATAIIATKNLAVSVGEIEAAVARVRGRRGNLEKAFHVPKTALAARLWPVLEERLANCPKTVVDAIPIVRVLDLALRLASDESSLATLVALHDEQH